MGVRVQGLRFSCGMGVNFDCGHVEIVTQKFMSWPVIYNPNLERQKSVSTLAAVVE